MYIPPLTGSPFYKIYRLPEICFERRRLAQENIFLNLHQAQATPMTSYGIQVFVIQATSSPFPPKPPTNKTTNHVIHFSPLRRRLLSNRPFRH